MTNKKKPLFGNKRSHANNANRRKQQPNYKKISVNNNKIKATVRDLKKNSK